MLENVKVPSTNLGVSSRWPTQGHTQGVLEIVISSLSLPRVKTSEREYSKAARGVLWSRLRVPHVT